MAFGRTFKEALQKALRSLETGRYGLGGDGKDRIDPALMSEPEKLHEREQIAHRLRIPKAGRIYILREAFQLGLSIDEIHAITKIDRWFLFNLEQIVKLEEELREYQA